MGQERRTDGAFMGCWLRATDSGIALRPAEVGWRLGVEFWGNGYATEAAARRCNMALANWRWMKLFRSLIV